MYICIHTRKCIPDSIQAGGMWQFIQHLQIPSATFLYADEPYGAGLFQAINALATAAGQTYRLNSVPVRYMPGIPLHDLMYMRGDLGSVYIETMYIIQTCK